MLSGIPYYEDSQRNIWLDQLWHRDLLRHLVYLPRFTLVAPRSEKRDKQGLVRVDPDKSKSMCWVDAGPRDSWKNAIQGLPHLVRVLWREIGKHEIVHGGVTDWPFPILWLAYPIAKVRGRKMIVVVESSPWRLTQGRAYGLKARIRERVQEAVAKFIVSRADLALFTQPEYRNSLFRGGRGRAEVTPASWIERSDLLGISLAEETWREKRAERPVQILFAGRLVPDKGIEILLDALSILERQGCELVVKIMGSGDLQARCEQAAIRQRAARIELVQPVRYGPEFFQHLRSYHALFVPSLSDEQARILFDAQSQAVPIIASNTPGNRHYIIDGETGWLVPSGDADELARILIRATKDVNALEEMGLNGRKSVEDSTHEAMHANRLKILHEVFD
jgi:glycosyltransferase involved in cell wall biosynthesis